MAQVPISAMAITMAVSFAPLSQKTAKAADSVTTYNAYTIFQTDQKKGPWTY